jgi:hypothetical protein
MVRSEIVAVHLMVWGALGLQTLLLTKPAGVYPGHGK